MPYARETLSQIRLRVASDIEAAQPGTDALLRFSPLRIIGAVQAGLAHQHNGYLDYIAKQSVPWTSTGEYLAAWGALKRVYVKDASTSSGVVSFPGSVGSLLDVGTSIVRGDGVAYITTAAATVSAAGTVTAPAVAVVAGAAGNYATGSLLTLAKSAPGIQSSGVAAIAFIGGADQEIEDAFYERVMSAYQSSPQGGAIDDYPAWATAVSGVTRAWCNPNGFGAGSVVVYFMMDQVEAAHSGFPQGTDGVSAAETRSATKATGEQLIVANQIFTLRPATALVYCCAPLPHTISFILGGLSSASAATRASVRAAIADALIRNGSPKGGTVTLSTIQSAIGAISAAAGFVISQVTGTVDSTTSPIVGNIVSPLGYLPTLGDVSYV